MLWFIFQPIAFVFSLLQPQINKIWNHKTNADELALDYVTAEFITSICFLFLFFFLVLIWVFILSTSSRSSYVIRIHAKLDRLTEMSSVWKICRFLFVSLFLAHLFYPFHCHLIRFDFTYYSNAQRSKYIFRKLKSGAKRSICLFVQMIVRHNSSRKFRNDLSLEKSHRRNLRPWDWWA